jgi:hypothetical protein
MIIWTLYPAIFKGSPIPPFSSTKSTKMYLSLTTKVLVLGAVAFLKGLPFFAEEDSFVPQNSGTTA